MFLVIKKRMLIIIALVLLLFLAGAGVTAVVAAYVPKSQITVVIDAGHGGIDGGSIGVASGVKEANINLAIAEKLKSILEAKKYNVVMTRHTESGSGLGKQSDMKQRKDIINKANADVVVSIHCNKFLSPHRRGAQVFFDRSSEKGQILAKLIQSNLNKQNKLYINKDYSALKGEYYILQCSPFPSVIVECGFLSNPEDEKLLCTNEFQQSTAELISDGIVAFLVNAV